MLTWWYRYLIWQESLVFISWGVFVSDKRVYRIIPYSIHNWIPAPIWKLPFQKLPSFPSFHRFPPTHGFSTLPHRRPAEVFNIASVAYGISHVGSLCRRGRCAVSNTGPRLERWCFDWLVGLGWLGGWLLGWSTAQKNSSFFLMGCNI